jgi:hypothetical protein
MEDTGIADQERETGGPDPVQESGGSIIRKEERLHISSGYFPMMTRTAAGRLQSHRED